MSNNSIRSGIYVVDEDGFHLLHGRGKNRRVVMTTTLDELLVEMRQLTRNARDWENCGNDGTPGHLADLKALARAFESLDDWLSSGRRTPPKSWAFGDGTEGRS